MVSVTNSFVIRRTTRSRGDRMASLAASRSGSCASIQANLAATAPASSGIPVRARLMSSPPMSFVSVAASGAPRRSDHKMPFPIGSPARVTGTKVWRAPEHATTSTWLKASGACALASAQAITTDVHQRSGSCSAHPTCGWVVVSSDRVRATRPSSCQRPTLVTVVPKSTVRIITGGPARRSGPPSRPVHGPGTPCVPWPCRHRHLPSRRAPRRARRPARPCRSVRPGRGRARRRWPPPGPRRAVVPLPVRPGGPGP